MRFIRLREHQSKGDTIVEVLIAIAVVSSVLAGAFMVTQKSAQAVRDGQERSELLHIMQGQIEQTRGLAVKETSDTTGVFGSDYFCVQTVGGIPTKVSLGGFTLPALTADNFSGYGGCRFGQNGRYAISVKYNASTKLFTATGRWDTVNGNKGQQRFSYRMYPGGN